jgi:type II secretory ATPase GspE/PulE/Tfp pilus assembly ATPase PilB-like protein
MELNEEIRRKILANSDAGELTATARARGMRSLAEDGWEKVRGGITSPEEVLRVTQAL